jgi:eukaryotic-like serine/threonine-protein kinase
MAERGDDKTMPAWRPPASATRGLADTAPASAVVGEHSMVRPTEAAAHSGGDNPLSLKEGDIVGGRYRVKERVGEGGFAAVYRAYDNEISSHEVALKLLHVPAKGPDAQAAALRELTLIASVSHPSVVQFKDYGWHEGRLFFAMPWYRGRTLASALPLDRADARRVFERCAYGLHAMHEAGIFHYDIKPDNIFLANIEGFDAGFPVLLDLGIAAKRGEKPTALTPEYASPEVAQAVLDGGQTQVGAASDVYSLALSLRNVLEPESAPVLAESLPAILHKRATEPVTPPSRKDLRYLAPLFSRWLSVNPEDRPTAAEFAAQLRALTEPEERRAERRRLLMRAAPVVAVLLMIAGGLYYQLSTAKEELVQTKAVAAQEEQKANQRFASLKLQSKNQLDEKLQLAQEFQAQRDQFREQRDRVQADLGVMTEDRDRTRTDLRARTRERDQTRTELATTTNTLNTTRADLAQKTSDLASRRQELAEARVQIGNQTAEIEKKTANIERLRGDLAERESELQSQGKQLQEVRAAQAKLAQDLLAQRAQLESARADLEAAKKDRDKARGQVADLERDVTAREKERDKARAEIETLEKQLAAARAKSAISEASSTTTDTTTETPKKKKKKSTTTP